MSGGTGISLQSITMKGVHIGPYVSPNAPVAPASPPIMAIDPANYASGTVPDTSGNGNNLSVNGGTYNAGDAGDSISWAPSAYGTVASSSTLGALSNAGFSISTWVKFPSFVSGSNPIIECATNGTNSGASWGWRVDAGGQQLNLVKYNVADENVGITQLSTNTWYHLLASMGPGGVSYYVNGVLAGTAINTSAMHSPSGKQLTYARANYYNGNSTLTMGVNSIYDIELTLGNAKYVFNQDAVRYGYTPLT